MMSDAVFLGTGAGEMYPNPFCDCEVCRRARANGELRFRSDFLLDEKTMIDFGPDLPAASLVYHVPLCDLENVLITHTHPDHLEFSPFLVLLGMKIKNTIHFYLTTEAMKLVQDEMSIGSVCGGAMAHLVSQKVIDFTPIELYRTYQIGDKKVTAFPSNHTGCGAGEPCANYLIEWSRGLWLYAVDGGVYDEGRLEFLRGFCAEHGAIDVMITEGTRGSMPGGFKADHIGAEGICLQMKNLMEIGAVNRNTSAYVTHICQVQKYSQAEYQRALNRDCPIPIVIAYDGMRI